MFVPDTAHPELATATLSSSGGGHVTGVIGGTTFFGVFDSQIRTILGTEISVTAGAEPDYRLARWEIHAGPDSRTVEFPSRPPLRWDTQTVLVADDSVSARAIFEYCPSPVLTIRRVLEGEGDRSDPQCGGYVLATPAMKYYGFDQSVHLDATPFSKCCYGFQEWKGLRPPAEEPQSLLDLAYWTTIWMTEDREIVAVFKWPVLEKRYIRVAGKTQARVNALEQALTAWNPKMLEDSDGRTNGCYGVEDKNVCAEFVVSEKVVDPGFPDMITGAGQAADVLNGTGKYQNVPRNWDILLVDALVDFWIGGPPWCTIDPAAFTDIQGTNKILTSKSEDEVIAHELGHTYGLGHVQPPEGHELPSMGLGCGKYDPCKPVRCYKLGSGTDCHPDPMKNLMWYSSTDGGHWIHEEQRYGR